MINIICWKVHKNVHLESKSLNLRDVKGIYKFWLNNYYSESSKWLKK